VLGLDGYPVHQRGLAPDAPGLAFLGVDETGQPVKRQHLEHSPFVSVTYWSPDHDTCTAECEASWSFDDDRCIEVWEQLKHAPEPVGYDPAIIPVWADGPTSESFAVLELSPWRVRVMPGTVMTAGAGEVLTWAR